MDRERRRILRNAQDTIDEIEQVFRDCAHWNVDCDPDGKMRLMADALRDMLARDKAKGHVGKTEAPLMALVIQKGPEAPQ